MPDVNFKDKLLSTSVTYLLASVIDSTIDKGISPILGVTTEDIIYNIVKFFLLFIIFENVDASNTYDTPLTGLYALNNLFVLAALPMT